MDDLSYFRIDIEGVLAWPWMTIDSNHCQFCAMLIVVLLIAKCSFELLD